MYSQDIGKAMEDLMEEIKEKDEGYLMIGDFNARTGNEGGPIESRRYEEEETRRSKDKVLNKEGRVMLSKIRERGWIIANGIFEKEGNWTHRRSGIVGY